ncbi:MAG: hypothetical protein JXR73_14565 [Candidatus Omnitrophica bacterium]|nr:hypothetical protein [Candidatus Omnitrophota bacterium]
MDESKRASDLKLIDLLSLRPGSLLSVHSIKGKINCSQAEAIKRGSQWRQEVSAECFPNGDLQKIHNFSKLLEISIDAQVIVRHPNGKVVEILRLEPHSWRTILSRVGHRASVMVDGRIFAEGNIVNDFDRTGILINKVMGL